MTTQERLDHFLNQTPDLEQAAFVAANATIQGAVTLGRDASVFYQAVLRGDIQTIRIGDGTNIQDGTIVHLADELGVEIGDFTTVGHGAIIHACKIGSECLIGMRSTILDGAVIPDHCLVAAGSVVTPGSTFPSGSMIMGAPAKLKRPLEPGEISGLRSWAEKYIVVARAHALRQTSIS